MREFQCVSPCVFDRMPNRLGANCLRDGWVSKQPSRQPRSQAPRARSCICNGGTCSFQPSPLPTSAQFIYKMSACVLGFVSFSFQAWPCHQGRSPKRPRPSYMTHPSAFWTDRFMESTFLPTTLKNYYYFKKFFVQKSV